MENGGGVPLTGRRFALPALLWYNFWARGLLTYAKFGAVGAAVVTGSLIQDPPTIEVWRVFCYRCALAGGASEHRVRGVGKGAR